MDILCKLHPHHFWIQKVSLIVKNPLEELSQSQTLFMYVDEEKLGFYICMHMYSIIGTMQV